MSIDEQFMQRCLQLARLGAGYVAPNPLVGAVLVYDGQIIGEGYHRQYGKAHAEVNCLEDAINKAGGKTEELAGIVARSTLYVSLEPCAHFGKTPPCADLIIRYKIPRVVIGCRDPFNEVNGKGIEKLKAAGVEVVVGILEKECTEINKRFFTFHLKKRPYIILKWAQTSDGKIGSNNNERLMISNEFTNHLVHQWRSEEAGILVGTNTALKDDPALTNRLWDGPSPLRLVLDNDLKLSPALKVFDKSNTTIIFNRKKNTINTSENIFLKQQKNNFYYKLPENEETVSALVNAFYQSAIQSVLVEGGAKLLQSFIDAGLWDEARVITNNSLTYNGGVNAPLLQNAVKGRELTLHSDRINFYSNHL